MENLILLEKAESYISNLFLNANTSGLFYHNYNHTLSVVEGAEVAANAIPLSRLEKDTLILSAWFHDVGYLYTRTEHEAKSIEIVQNALRPNFIEFIKPVTTCIEATKVGEKPKNELAALLKDIDVSFGAANNFQETSDSFREELILSEGKYYTDEVWRKMCIDFLENIEFYSDYGKRNFGPLVAQNLEAYLDLEMV